jgi:hypothetical protein|tara:strand:+ start:3505 stop:5190 length:1686 start_codon:yes stop_codon:yes gene_type:complete
MANQNNLLSANPLNDPNYDYTTILPFRIRNLLDVDELSTDVTPELAVPGLARDVGNAAVRMGQTVRGHRPVDAGQTFIDMLEVAPAGLLGKAPAGALASGLARRAQNDINNASSGGRYSPPRGVPSDGAPQPLLPYPPTRPPEWQFDPKKGSEIDERPGYAASIIHGERAGERKRVGDYLAKVNSPEALQIKKQVEAAQRDIDAGNYVPMFDVSKRTDVDASTYKSGEPTQKVAWAKQPKTQQAHRARATANGTERLEGAFKEGLKIPDANNWYYMGQLENTFIKRLGAKEGRARFRAKFAGPMAATTGGATPKENLRTAMYGNFLRENNIPYPKNAYDMPFPAGGRYISGNIRQHQKLMGGPLSSEKNPKRHNFEGNFLGQKEWATVDEQMSGLFDPKLKNPQGDSYGAYEEVIIKLAKKYDVSPREFQEVAWAGAKKTKEGKRYSGSKPMIQEVNEAIERTARVTGLTPKEILEKGIMDSKMPIFSQPGSLGLTLFAKEQDQRSTIPASLGLLDADEGQRSTGRLRNNAIYDGLLAREEDIARRRASLPTSQLYSGGLI